MSLQVCVRSEFLWGGGGGSGVGWVGVIKESLLKLLEMGGR